MIAESRIWRWPNRDPAPPPERAEAAQPSPSSTPDIQQEIEDLRHRIESLSARVEAIENRRIGKP